MVTSRHTRHSHHRSGHHHGAAHSRHDMASGATEGSRNRDWLYAAERSGRVGLAGSGRESDAGGEHLTIESQHYVSQLIAHNPEVLLEPAASGTQLALPASEPARIETSGMRSRQVAVVEPTRIVYAAMPSATMPGGNSVSAPTRAAPLPVIHSQAPAPSYVVASRYPPTSYAPLPPEPPVEPMGVHYVNERQVEFYDAPHYPADAEPQEYVPQYVAEYPGPYVDESYPGAGPVMVQHIAPPPQQISEGQAPFPHYPPTVYVEDVGGQPELLHRQGSGASFRTIDHFASAPSSFRTGPSVRAEPTYSAVRRGAGPVEQTMTAAPVSIAEHRQAEEGMLSPGGSYPSLYTIPQTNSMRSAASRTEPPAPAPMSAPGRPVPAYQAPPPLTRDDAGMSAGPALPPRRTAAAASASAYPDSAMSQPWPTFASDARTKAVLVPPPPVPPPARVSTVHVLPGVCLRICMDVVALFFVFLSFTCLTARAGAAHRVAALGAQHWHHCAGDGQVMDAPQRESHYGADQGVCM
jgi:hypothetical protein